VEFDSQSKAFSIEEKPSLPKPDFTVKGFYFYDNKVIKIAKHIQTSKTDALEITDII